MSQFDFFKVLPISELISFIYEKELQIFPKEAVIFQENDSPEYIYIIREGEIQLSQSIDENIIFSK
jgi:CRP-like cAMP-binding protein